MSERIKSSQSRLKFIFFPLRVKSHIHICQDVRHVFLLALSASPDFWDKHGLNAVRWARASLRNTSSCLCNTTIVCCPSSGRGASSSSCRACEQTEKLAAKVWQSMEIPDKVQKYKHFFIFFFARIMGDAVVGGERRGTRERIWKGCIQWETKQEEGARIDSVSEKVKPDCSTSAPSPASRNPSRGFIPCPLLHCLCWIVEVLCMHQEKKSRC